MEKHAGKPTEYPAVPADILAAFDAKQASIDHERFKRDDKYLVANYDRLLAEYPWKWIAIFEGKIVAVEDSWDDLLEALEHGGIPRSKAVKEHMEPGALWIY